MNRNISSETVLLIFSGVIALLLVVLITGRITAMNETSKAVNAETTKLTENQAKLSGLIQLNKKKAELERSLEVLGSQIPAQPSEDDIIAEFQTYSSENNAEFEQIQFGEHLANGNINEMPMKMTFSGKFTSIVKLIENIKNGERLIRIDEIQISKIENTGDKLKVDISASAFCK